MKVYIDILFLINFITDYIVIGITSAVMSASVKWWRHILSAVAGGITGVIFFMPDLTNTASFTASLISGAIMALIAFHPCKSKEFLKRLGVMYLSSALLAGTGILYMSLFGGGIIKNGIFYVNTYAIIFVSTAIYIVTATFISKLRRRALQKLSQVILEYKGHSVSMTGFTDTGNGLYDPVSGKPVILIDEEILKTLVNENCTVTNIYEWADSETLRFIPYSTVSGDGILTAIKLDRVIVDGKTAEDVIAAISINSLKYPIILHTGM